MAEKVSDFARRLGSELTTFAGSKGRELADKVQETSTRLVSEAERQSYNVALSVVAKYHNITTKEVEKRLSEATHTRRGSK